MNRKFFAISTAILTVVGSVLFLPVLLQSEVLEPICTIAVVNAQENPCLVQEATLAVLGLQATIDARDYQATISALESSSFEVDYQSTISALEQELAAAQTFVPISTSQPSVGLPFREDFNNNQRGWDLTPRSEGVVRLSQNKLLMTAYDENALWTPIPGLDIGDNFYIQATVIPLQRDYLRVGFAQGDSLTDQYHMFVAGAGSVRFFNELTQIFVTEYDDDLWRRDVAVTVGLEANGGLYTLYVNGVATETAQIIPYGREIGPVVYSQGGGELSASFDEIIVRESR